MHSERKSKETMRLIGANSYRVCFYMYIIHILCCCILVACTRNANRLVKKSAFHFLSARRLTESVFFLVVVVASSSFKIIFYLLTLQMFELVSTIGEVFTHRTLFNMRARN